MRPRPTRAREFVRLTARMGFYFVRQKGSHAMYRHADGRSTSVPDHPGDIPTGTLREMVKQIGLTTEQFNEEI